MSLDLIKNSIRQKPAYESKDGLIYCDDCMNIMPQMREGCVDLVVTDPPYNAKNIGPQQKTYSIGEMQLPQREYMKFCKRWFIETQRFSRRLIFTPGISNMCHYKQPYWAICWHKPAAVSYNRMGGYNAWEPIFVYGKIPKGKRLPQDYVLFNTLNLKKGPESKHPCPKVLKLLKWILNTFSNEDEFVFDPFLGSGTTAVAAKQLRRKFVGIEINPDYVKIAIDRLRQEILL